MLLPELLATPAIILSSDSALVQDCWPGALEAGGTGLNLTAATHVLHADRWWNPAVENQATDRAYRIGQTQFVHVHKFVTIGTIEEKIDSLLTQKQSMSEEFIQSSQWMTELSDNELKELFSFN